MSMYHRITIVQFELAPLQFISTPPPPNGGCKSHFWRLPLSVLSDILNNSQGEDFLKGKKKISNSNEESKFKDAITHIWKYVWYEKKLMVSTLNVANDNSLETYLRVTNTLDNSRLQRLCSLHKIYTIKWITIDSTFKF